MIVFHRAVSLLFLVLGSFLWLAAAAAANAPALALAKTISNPAAADSDQFGYSVALAGSSLVIGAPFSDMGGSDAGAAYLFSGGDGTLLQTLQEPEAAAGDWFGISVAAVGENVLVGALGYDSPVTDAGAAYLFDGKTGDVLLKLQEPAPHDSDWFGGAVAAAGQNLLVGAPLDHVNGVQAGGVYLFDGATGTLMQSFHKPKPAADDWFGVSMAATGDNVLVGAFLDDTGAKDAGAAYLFDGKTGALLRTFQKPKPAANDQFGVSVAVAGDTVIVGAPNDNMGKTHAGGVYMFEAGTGQLLRTLQNPAPVAGELFGSSVAVAGTDILVGAPGDGTTKGGAVYRFDSASGALLQRFQNTSPAGDDKFGFALAGAADRVLIAAPGDHAGSNLGGAAFLFKP